MKSIVYIVTVDTSSFMKKTDDFWNILRNNYFNLTKNFQVQYKSCFAWCHLSTFYKNVKQFKTLPIFCKKKLWNEIAAADYSLLLWMNSVIWRISQIYVVHKWIWQKIVVKMMMPMEDIPSPRTAGESILKLHGLQISP